MQPEQIDDAKYVICAVAQRIFEPDMTVEAFGDMLDKEHELDDVDDYQKIYTEDRGLFLVALDKGKVVGTSAVRRKSDEVAELKRIWLLESYHGQKIGYRMVNMLLDFAREQGYQTAYLESTRRNTRALAFYKRIGFGEVPSPYEDEEDLSMEKQIKR
jgi:ribosomal protein S18 acetylase RimI-like enzyme